MKNSVIISFFISLWNNILLIYNNCFVEKIIKSICGFFKTRADASRICSIFTNRFLDGEYYKNSVLFKIVTSPVRLVLLISKKVSEKLLTVINESEIFRIYDNFLYIPIREYGYIISAFSVGVFVSSVISGALTLARIAVLAVLAVISVVFWLTPATINSTADNSFIARLVKKIFNVYVIDNNQSDRIYNIKPIRTFTVISLVFGLVSGILSPAIAVVSVIGALVMLLMLHNTLAGIFISVLAAPILPTMVCAGLIALTFVSFIIKLISQKNEKYIITPMSFLIIGFLLLAAFSSFTSFNIPKSVLILVLYIVFALMYFLIVNNIKTKNQWYNLVAVFVIAGTLVGLYGVYQNFFSATLDSSWVDTSMFEDIKTRVYSTFDNPNVLGQYLVLVAPIAFAVMWSVKDWFRRVAFFLAFAVMCACLVFTWSRAAWVAIILAIGFFLVIKDRRWASLCVLALFVMPFVLPESIISRITSIGDFSDSSTAYRFSVWIASLRMAKDFWISGIGLGSGAFERVYQNYALNGAGFAIHSHNFYIQLVVEMGILGLVFFLLMILSSYKQIISIKEKNTINKNVAVAMGGALLGYLFQGVAENLWYNYRMVLLFWIYMGILHSGVNVTKNSPQVLEIGKDGIKE